MPNDDEPMSENIERVNLDYFDGLYHYRSPLLHLVHALLSFDSKSKSRVNHRIIQRSIRNLIDGGIEIKILDYGCGRGAFLLGLPRKSVVPYCFDISPNAVTSARAMMRLLHRQVEVIKFDEEGRIQPDDFSLILVSHVLEHVEFDIDLLQMLVDALRPGGYILVNVPINEVWEDHKHVRTYSPDSLRWIMAKANLKIIKEHRTDRWTGFLLDQEKNHPRTMLRRLLLRPLRLLLAIVPSKLLRWSEDFLLKEYPYQQLVVLGVK